MEKERDFVPTEKREIERIIFVLINRVVTVWSLRDPENTENVPGQFVSVGVRS